MSAIERVRAVLAAGTPGPLYVIGTTVRAQGSGTRIGSFSSFEDAAQTACTVNLAPAFVALWAAAAAWEDERHGNGNEYEVAAALEEALAALNEAAAREVGPT